MLSNNNGATFSPFNSGFNNNNPLELNIHDLAYSNYTLYAANDVGVWEYSLPQPSAWVYLPIMIK